MMLGVDCQSSNTNRNVLITGAARRTGRAIAETLARRGWGVVVHTRDALAQADALCAALTAEGMRAWRATGDLAADGGADAIFDAALAAAGALDAVVNNAARFERTALADAAPADFDRLWRINTLAPIRLTQRLAAHLAARGTAGSVVNLLDQRIAYAGDSGAIPYFLSKKTLEAFTLAAASELAPTVRVNAVAPGAVLTPAAPEARETAGAFPLGRRPTLDDVAQAVAYLLGADAVTGQLLYIDGGQHLPSHTSTASSTPFNMWKVPPT